MHVEQDMGKAVAELLKSILKNGQGVQHIMNTAYKILGNPILLNDTSYRLLAYTENTVTDDPLWNELLSLGAFSHETVNFFREEGFIDEVADCETLALLKSGKLGYDRVNGKIFDKGGVHIANICAVACYKPFVSEDFRLIEKLCEAISEELQRSEFYRRIERIYQETYITKLLEGQRHEGALERSELDAICNGLKSNLYLAVVDIARYDHNLIHLGYFRDVFSDLQRECKYYIHLNNIVILISTDSMLDVKSDLSALGKFFAENSLYVGISSKFHNLFKLRKYYRQALHALNYGMDAYQDQNIFQYDDFRIDHLFTVIKDGIEEDDICDPTSLAVLEYDRKYFTGYFDILYRYLLHGRNLSLAARHLRMDESELEGKLGQISGIFKVDWDNGNRLFHIFLSMKFMKDSVD